LLRGRFDRVKKSLAPRRGAFERLRQCGVDVVPVPLVLLVLLVEPAVPPDPVVPRDSRVVERPVPGKDPPVPLRPLGPFA
jgi:hypothetical protein